MKELGNPDYKQLEKDLLKFLGDLNLNYKFIINRAYQGLNFASFGYDKIINLNAIPLEKRAKEKNWPVEDTFLLALCHELGHAEDPEYSNLYSKVNATFNEFESFRKQLARLRQFKHEDFDKLNDILDEYNKLTQKMETNAMNIGERFIPDRLKKQFEEDNNENLRLYYFKVMDLRRIDKVFYELRDTNADLTKALKEYEKKLKAIDAIRRQ